MHASGTIDRMGRHRGYRTRTYGCVGLAIFISGTAAAALDLDADFWQDYVPYQQYTDSTLRDLYALQEGDLLETAREIDGLELRVIGRASAGSDLISARVVIDSVVRQRLQVKIVPFSLSPNSGPRPRLQRRQLSGAQADSLLALLEQLSFWQAPYASANRNSEAADTAASGTDPRCDDAGHWIIEAVRPGSYQFIARSSCMTLDPLVTEIRDYLFGLAAIAADP